MTSTIISTLEVLNQNPTVQKVLADIKADDARALDELKTIQQIPSPPFHEDRRIAYFVKRFKELGLTDVRQDQEGNVIGMRPGSGGAGAPTLVIDAHLDTVFPEETDLTLKIREDGAICGPGICDDARGLTSVLAVLKAFQDHNIKTVGNLMFVGSVGEEELGDLRGIKALFRENQNIDGFIGIDGCHQGRIIGTCTGSRRYLATFKSPGGHSWNAFGTPSAVHAAGRAITKIADMEVPADPKTSFTVGTVSGGTTINSIAAEATIGIDMRSMDEGELAKLEQRVLKLLDEAVADENRRWKSDVIKLELKPVGNRPAGMQPEDAMILQGAKRSLELIGFDKKIWFGAASTNANVPISMGIPAVDLGVGGESGGEHTLAEWYKHIDAYQSAQNVFLLALGLVGLDGVSEPQLPKRTKNA